MSTTKKETAEFPACKTIEEILKPLGVDAVTGMAENGLEWSPDDIAVFLGIKPAADGSLALELELYCWASVPLTALLKHVGREDETDDLDRGLRAECGDIQPHNASQGQSLGSASPRKIPLSLLLDYCTFPEEGIP